MQNLLDQSAVALARRIRTREVSPVEVIDQHITRIEAVNPAINAVIADRFERARDEARAAEVRLMQPSTAAEDLPPLFGLPFTTKEFIAAEGMPLSAGIWSRRETRATEDAETIRRLRNAGAILVGITNVPEGGLWLETYNTVYGHTLNPWNPRRTSGGSSGGEGAIISAGGVAFGLGADIGGSIRIPAAFCGIVGHKPTGRMVPNTGLWPLPEGELSAYHVCGPMTRRVEDVMPILRTLAGPDGVDPVTRPWTLEDETKIDLRDVTVYPLETNGRTRVWNRMRVAVREATDALAARGAKIGQLDLPSMRRAFEIWSAMMTTAGETLYTEVLGNGTPVALPREFLRVVRGRSRHTLPALIVAAADVLARRLPGTLDRMVQAGRALQHDLEDILGPRGVLLHPPYTRPAPRHFGPLITPFDFVCTALFNVMEFPSTTLPVGFDRHGLPVGVQVIGRRGADALTVAVASALERDFGGWRRSEPRADRRVA